MKKIYTLLTFILFIGSVNAQITFQRYYSTVTGFNSGLSMHPTSDGGYIMSGNNNLNGIDGFIFKTDSTGNIEWTQKVGDTRTDILFSVKQINNGNFIAAGYSLSFSPDSNSQFYVMKFNANGNVLWEKVYGANAGTNLNGKRIIQTSDGGFLVAGSKNDSQHGSLYLKLDSTGAISWGKYIDGVIGSYGVESVKQTSDHGYIITGNGGLLIKTDSLGDVTWSKMYIPGSKSLDVSQTSDGGYLMAGQTSAVGAGNLDMYLVKTDSTGDVEWCKTYGGASNDYTGSALQSSDGGYIITGSSFSFGSGGFDMLIVKTDSSGNLTWSKTYGGGGGEQTYSAYEVNDGFVFGGLTNSFGTLTNSSYLVKTDFNGNSGCHQTSPSTVVITSQTISATVSNDLASNFIPVASNSSSTVTSGPVANNLCLATGIKNVNENKFDFGIIPNPAHEKFTASFKEVILSGKIELYNSLGSIIHSEEIKNESVKEVFVNYIPSGIYFVRVSDGENTYCKKIIID